MRKLNEDHLVVLVFFGLVGFACLFGWLFFLPWRGPSFVCVVKLCFWGCIVLYKAVGNVLGNRNFFGQMVPAV